MSIELQGLSHSYLSSDGKEINAIKNLSLTIGEGELVGIMGHTGCGKTTLIQLIAGLIAPTAGKVLIDGRDINAGTYDKSLLRQRLGVVFQYPEYQLFESTVEKDVAFGLKHSGLSKPAVTDRVRRALELMGFDYELIRAQSPLALSGGEKRRIAIAGVLAVEPEILIFDEPVAGLDPMGRRDFIALIKRLNQGGTTIIIVSHNADALSECAGRLVVLSAGELAIDGAVSQVFDSLSDSNVLPAGASSAHRIAARLKSEGMALPADIVNYQDLLTALTETLKGGKAQ